MVTGKGRELVSHHWTSTAPLEKSRCKSGHGRGWLAECKCGVDAWRFLPPQGGGVCVFIFQLVGVELKTNQIMLHVASPDADTQGLPFFVPCTPPTSCCFFVCVFFFWYQGDLVTRFSTDAFITLKRVSYFQSSPSSIFFAFALTRSIMGVRCLCKRAKGRQKGHESQNLGSHLLGTQLLAHPKQNGGWWPNMKY